MILFNLINDTIILYQWDLFFVFWKFKFDLISKDILGKDVSAFNKIQRVNES